MTILVGFHVNREHWTNAVPRVIVETIDFNWVRGECIQSWVSGHSMIGHPEMLPRYLLDYLFYDDSRSGSRMLQHHFQDRS